MGFPSILVAILLWATRGAFADTYHVWRDSPSFGPGVSWSNAFHDIQSAIDAAADGDTVLVTNGTYALSSQLLLAKGVSVRGVNGASHTFLDGSNRVRCVYMSHTNAVIDGFTLQNGRGQFGGGVYCREGGSVLHCVITRNSAYADAQAASASGGGAYVDRMGLIDSCEIVDNSSHSEWGFSLGGGVSLSQGGTLINSLVARNSATIGDSSIFSADGGGVKVGLGTPTVENCTISDNSARIGGGLSLRSAGVVRNTIIAHNTATIAAPDIHIGGEYANISESCMTPLIPGPGNIAALPAFVDRSSGNYSLLPGSPCVDAGAMPLWASHATDLAGHERVQNGEIDLGAYEYMPRIDGLVCNFRADQVRTVSPATVTFNAYTDPTNTGHFVYSWDFDGDGYWDAAGTNLSSTTHLYTTGGEYSVALRVVRALGESAVESKPRYITVGRRHYVSPAGSAEAPYTNWATAARDIQVALDSTAEGDIVLVTDGVYSVSSQIEVTKGITVCSANGPDVTTIEGCHSCRCLFIQHPYAVVDGFSLVNGNSAGAPGGYGGAAVCEYEGTIRNCHVSGSTSGMQGGGIALVWGGLADRCVVSRNASTGTEMGHSGGGIFCYYGGVARNCFVYGNTAGYEGGGVLLAGGRVENCTVAENTAPRAPDIESSRGIAINMAVPITKSASQPGNFTRDTPGLPPRYVEEALGFVAPWNGDFRLLPGSPYIDGGVNRAWMTNTLDLAGTRRVWNGVADIGAYEFDPRPLTCNVAATVRWGTEPLEVGFFAILSGTNTSGLFFTWDFDGDGSADARGPNCGAVTNVYGRAGQYTVVLSVSNATGEVATVTRPDFIDVSHATHYVSPSGTHVYPFSTWATAATNIQSAVDAGRYGSLVLVTNGTYALHSEICVTEHVVIRSVNGANGSVVDGNGVTRCFRLSHPDATIDGFRVIRGSSADGAGISLADGTDVRNCIISDNFGVGIYGNGSIRNCLIADNVGNGVQGGVNANVSSCTIVRNSGVGIVLSGRASGQNCISYHNQGGNWQLSTGASLDFSCTTPSPGGYGIVTNTPEFASAERGDYHLLPASPCVDTGTNQYWMAGACDLDGRARILGPGTDIGAYESGPLACGFTVLPNPCLANSPIQFTATVSGTNTTSVAYSWDFDSDGNWEVRNVTSSRVTHAFPTYGRYTATLLVTNGVGESAIVTKVDCVEVSPATLYVSPGGSHTAPYGSWTTAARDVQTAVGIAMDGATVLVSNGTYELASEIDITNAITVMSSQGAVATTLSAAGSSRCLRLSHTNAVVRGLTISGGRAASGGGVYCDGYGLVRDCIIRDNIADGSHGGGVYLYRGGTVWDCLIVSNRAANSAGAVMCDRGGLVRECVVRDNRAEGGFGGGLYLYGGTARNCLIAGNYATSGGGGVRCDGLGNLLNCTVVTNTAATHGGGIYCQDGGTVRNSVLYGNMAAGYPNWRNVNTGSPFSFCCTTPPPPGHGNVGADPVFVDPAHGDWRLHLASPCVDSGTNELWHSIGPDLAGNARVCNGTVDMGVYEFLPAELMCDVSSDSARGLAPLAVAYQSTVAGTNTSDLYYSWDFDGDGVFDLSGPGLSSVSHTYAVTGLYTVVLHVENSAHESARADKRDFIQVDPSVFLQGEPLRGAPPLRVVFTPTVLWTNQSGLVCFWDFETDGHTDRTSLGQACVTNTYANPGIYTVFLTASNSAGQVSSTAYHRYVYVSPATIYVSREGAGVAPYDTWETAATNLNDAAALAADGTLVFVTNGTYALTSPLTVNVGATIRSVGGPGVTVLDGQDAVQCVVLAHSNALVEGFSLTRGYSEDSGGAVHCTAGTVQDCNVTSSSAVLDGGGIACYGGRVLRCRVTDNCSDDDAGGVYCSGGALIRNSLIARNVCQDKGGGAYSKLGGTFENCTIVRNKGDLGGGLCWYGSGEARNCLIWDNTAITEGDNWLQYAGDPATFGYCCTVPLPLGDGHTALAPLLAGGLRTGDYRPLPGSPSINAGTNSFWMSSAVDIRGRARIEDGRVDIGAYEFYPDDDFPAIACDFVYGPQGGRAPLSVVFHAATYGTMTADVWYAWDFNDDGIPELFGSRDDSVTNIYDSPGTYSVRLVVSNAFGRTGSYALTDCIEAKGPPTVFVSLSGSHVWPFADWATAATDLHSALAAAEDGATMWIAGGVYELYSSLYVTNAVFVKAARGHGLAVLDGGNTVRCLRLNHPGAVIEGIMIRNGYTDDGNGAGVLVENGGTLRNCLIVSNYVSGGYGGGVCIAAAGRVENCTIVHNTASGRFSRAGGIYAPGTGQVVNSIIYGNSSFSDPNWYGSGMTLCFSCTTPIAEGRGNIAADPHLAVLPGDYRLLAASPCIDAGTNLIELTMDLGGVPRPLDGDGNAIAGWDIGAYEFCSSLYDTDQDGLVDSAEIVAGTDPLDSGSVLMIHSEWLDSVSGRITLSWQTVPGREYTVERTMSLRTGLWNNVAGYVRLPGTGRDIVCTDSPSNAALYRVRCNPNVEPLRAP